MNIYTQLYHDYDPPLTPFLYELSPISAPFQATRHSISYLTQDLGSPLTPLKLEDTYNFGALLEEPFQLELPQDKKEHFFDTEDTFDIGIVTSAREKQEKMLENYFLAKRQRLVEESSDKSASFACDDNGLRKTKKVKKARIILKRD